MHTYGVRSAHAAIAKFVIEPERAKRRKDFRKWASGVAVDDHRYVPPGVDRERGIVVRTMSRAVGPATPAPNAVAAKTTTTVAGERSDQSSRAHADAAAPCSSTYVVLRFLSSRLRP
jgi:hypothetical protein